MRLLIKQTKLFEPTHPLHLKLCDIFVVNGVIEDIQAQIEVADAEKIEANGTWTSIGYMDIGTQIGEPGYEHREDFQTVTAAAAAGGFTAIASFPNTHPVIQSKAKVNFLKNYAKENLVNFLPIGATTKDTEGKEMTEMYDMHQAGAIAFSDGEKPIQDTGMLLRVLQYAKAFNGIVVNHPHDQFVGQAQMHEGSVSTKLGMKGIPSLSEELMLQRDIELLAYTNSRLHVHNISTATAVEMIQAAKARGLNITASVSALHLLFNHNALSDFNPNFKVLPPLREETDRIALLQGVADGTIDCITSNHVPYEVESKFLEFSYAKFGAIALETAFITSWNALQSVLSPAQIIERWAFASRKAFDLNIPSIEVGAKANLTVFDPEKTWTVKGTSLYSKSKNSPFIGQQIIGKTILTINNHKAYNIWQSQES
ncbi:MAG: dihydroorotase [Bacteroidota bacterium]